MDEFRRTNIRGIAAPTVGISMSNRYEAEFR
jgi:hypothetical protein